MSTFEGSQTASTLLQGKVKMDMGNEAAGWRRADSFKL
jgi:hypothetical protein